jgi:predicted ATPase/class 3 adenylate cyclase
VNAVRAILLTDVVDSTQTTQLLGDGATAEVWAAHDRAARDLLMPWRGREIDKTDGMLLMFDTAADAVGYALAYHQALVALPQPLRARAALHVGPVVLRHNSASDIALGAKPIEVDGIAKPTAARAMALADGGQTFLTAEARAALGQTELRVQSHGHWMLKGIAKPIELFEVGEPGQHFAPPVDGAKAYRVTRVDGRWLPVAQVPNNLPQPVTRFIGRERELDEAHRLFENARLLSLTGSGGCGKTRLALQFAAERLGAYPHGVWFIELAALSDPGLVPQAVAAALGATEEPGKDLIHTISTALGTKRVLLVLDNVEHLLQAVGRLTDALLQACPDVAVLVTSREALGVRGEFVYRVPSLSLPEKRLQPTAESVAASEAVRLLVDRARAQVPYFAVTPQNATVVALVCARLDGIPLALELAAARLRSLSIHELSKRLDERFRLLTGGARTALPRQQTLRALIDWSYDLLDEAERTLLCRLSVFAGGWTLASAEAVTSGAGIDEPAVLGVLTALVDKSLVLADERAGEMRYRLLESVRQYARDRLLERGEGNVWRDRHAAHFSALGEAAEPRLAGAAQQSELEHLETEHDNLRAVLAWTSSPGGDALLGLRLAGALCLFWSVRGYPGEGRRWVVECLAAATDAPDGLRAGALCGAGVLAREQGDYAAARSLLEEGLELNRRLGHRPGIAAALRNLGSVRREQGDYDGARAFYEESLALRRDLGDRHGIASSLNSLGLVFRELGDYAQARVCFEESLAIDREIGDRLSIAVSLNNLGGMAADLCDYQTARAIHEESLAIRRELGSRRGIASSLTNLGDAVHHLGDHATARELLEEGLAIRRELGDRRGIGISLCALASASIGQGDLAQARAWGDESLALRRALGDLWGIAGTLHELGRIATLREKWDEAAKLYAESAQIERTLGDRWGAVESLCGLAGVAGALRRNEQAACIWGAAERLREEISAPMGSTERAAYERRVAEARMLGDAAAFQRSWQAGRDMDWDDAIGFAVAGADRAVT